MGNCRKYNCLADYIAANRSEWERGGDPRPGEMVYFIGSDDGPVKIGTTTNVEQRLESIQTGSHLPLKVLATAPGGRGMERGYHKYFASQRLAGEWFERCDDLEMEIRYWSRAARLSPLPSTTPAGAVG